MEHTERMGRDPILKLMLSFALPAMTGILAHALYNIVDRLFVGHWVGPAAIAGIIVAFPFMIAISAVGNFIGVGSATLISLALGAGRRGRAEWRRGQDRSRIRGCTRGRVGPRGEHAPRSGGGARTDGPC